MYELTYGRRLEGVFIRQVHSHFPHTTVIWRTLRSIEANHEFVKTTQNCHLMLRFNQLYHVRIHTALTWIRRRHLVCSVVCSADSLSFIVHSIFFYLNSGEKAISIFKWINLSFQKNSSIAAKIFKWIIRNPFIHRERHISLIINNKWQWKNRRVEAYTQEWRS